MAKRPVETVFRTLGDLCLGAVVLLVPFAVSVTADDAFRLPKLLAAGWLGLASLLVYGLAASARQESATAPPWRRPVVLAVVPILVAATFSLVAGRQAGLVRDGLFDLWVGGACLVGWSLALPARRLEWFLKATAVSGSLMGLLGVLQFHGLFRPFRFTTGEEASRLGVTALAGNPGDLGGFLVLPAVVAQWSLLRALRERRSGLPNRGWRIAAWAVAALLCLYGVVVTQTLTAVAALGVAVTVFWVLALPARRALPAAVVAGCLAVVAVGAVPPLRERAVRVGAMVVHGEWNQALTGRLDGWRAALWMFREHPWAGVGHGAYASEFAAAKLALLERGVEFYPAHLDPFFANAHNDLLEVLAEWGIVGAAALAAALALLVRALLVRGPEEDESEAAAARAFAWASVAGILVLAVGHFPFHLALLAYPFLVLFAWIFRRGDPGAAADRETAS